VKYGRKEKGIFNGCIYTLKHNDPCIGIEMTKKRITTQSLDPESRKYLIILDSRFRGNDINAGFMQFCKGLDLSFRRSAVTEKS
jgi:hypothetical protein